MNTISAPPDRASPSNGAFYWWCQLGAWSAFLLFEFFLVLGLRGGQANVRILVIYNCLIGLQGVLATHLLHLYARSRRWFQLPAKSLATRLAGTLALLSALLAWLGLLTHNFLTHQSLRQVLSLRDLLLRWLIHAVGLLIWVTAYVALHQFQWRRDAEGKALRLEMVAQEAQLRGLRAQLNPHFFFNCLNNLRELIAENPERAQHMVTQLSGLLRYSLRANQSELVPLTEEIRAVEDYLALETIRFEERLQVRWDIAPETRNTRIPPMLLQTLVENALKHGIARRPQGGEIQIVARASGLQMELEVLNTGKLREESSVAGIGLRNAQERLNLIYGGRARLVLENTNGGSVSARLTLPLGAVEVTA